MTKNVIMFPGQGSQFKGMGEQLFKQFPEEVTIANRILGYDLEELCLQNPDNNLAQTKYTQPALYVVNYLHYKAYRNGRQDPDFFIGHSLGEFNALQAAGVFDFENGLKIVRKRGELMFSVEGTSMGAVIGADYEEVNDILNNHFSDIDVANVNTRSQIVISGKTDSLNKAGDHFEDVGLAYVPLKVSGAFHSRYMSPVKQHFRKFIEGVDMHEAKIPVISNYTAKPYPKDRKAIIENMSQQIDHPIFWLQCIEYLMAQGETVFLELGPGEVLTNILKKIK
jgi:malonyl CoA-acyl carrier protein transacylase